MAYGRKRTYYRKRFRNRRTLSTRNIFNNKGSRAQASQINSLRKRINFVYKQCKPEVKTIESNPISLTLNYPGLADLPYHIYQVTMPELGVEDNARIGNACNILDSHIFMNMRLSWRDDTSYQINGLAQLVNPTIRIIPFMVKAATDYQPDPNEILTFGTPSTNAAIYRMNPIGPFNEGVSSKYHILGDYRYQMRFDDRAVINTKLKIKGSRIKKYIDTQYNSVGKAAIYLLITWNGLDPIQFQNETIARPTCYITLQDKTAYTDP